MSDDEDETITGKLTQLMRERGVKTATFTADDLARLGLRQDGMIKAIEIVLLGPDDDIKFEQVKGNNG